MSSPYEFPLCVNCIGQCEVFRERVAIVTGGGAENIQATITNAVAEILAVECRHPREILAEQLGRVAATA